MNTNDTSTEQQDQPAPPAPTATETPGQAVNGVKSPITEAPRPAVNGATSQDATSQASAVAGNGKAPPAQPPPERILHEHLDENDLQITLTAEVHGRKLTIAKCRCSATVYDGGRSHKRGNFFQTMTRLIDELKEGVAVKVNGALPEDPWPEDRKRNGHAAKPPLITEPLPPYSEDPDEDAKIREVLTIHTPPSLDVH